MPGLDTLSLGIDFDVTAFASAPDGAFEVIFDGLRTASLATNGPAFILPDGFFVTNASANVYNNHWIDPRATPAPVPLPAGAPLLLAGLASLGWIHRRRAGAGRRPFTQVGMAALTISAGIAFAPGQIHAATYSSFAQAIGATSGDPACGSVPLDTSSATNDTSSATYPAAESNCTANANATAGAGYASGIAMSSISPGGGGSTSSAARFDAFGISIDIADGYDEVSLSDLHPSGLIDVTLATTFSGTLEAQENQPGWNFGSGYGASIRGRVSFGNAWYDNVVRVGANGLEQYDIDVFSENIFLTQTVDWTEALSVTMILNVEAGGQGYFNGSNGFASADASNTLSFSKTGPVFILPEGFTVNAPELNIYDNRWIDPREPAPVPLPASLPLMLAALGLGGLLVRRRRGFGVPPSGHPI